MKTTRLSTREIEVLLIKKTPRVSVSSSSNENNYEPITFAWIQALETKQEKSTRSGIYLFYALTYQQKTSIIGTTTLTASPSIDTTDDSKAIKKEFFKKI